ncbi:AAA family ATPase [Bradyrhizobium sp. USDA 10063]
MRVTVDSIVSEKPFGIIFAGTVADQGSRRHGQRLRVRAELRHLLGVPAVGDTWEIDGEVLQTSYGPQVAARGGRRLLSSGHLVKQFLASHVPGVGIERAQRLWDAFGENLPEVLSTDDMLDKIATTAAPDKPALGARLAVLVASAWRTASSEAALVAWLDGLGVRDIGVVRRLHRALGDTAMEAIAANPYVMVPLLPWKQVDELGCRLLREDGREPFADARRQVGAADEAVKRMLHRGDTAATADEFTSALATLLGPASDGEAALTVAIANGAVLPSGRQLRAPGVAALEDDLVNRFRALSQRRPEPRLKGMSPSRWSEMLADLAGPGRTLQTEQNAAVVQAMSRPLACLVGGAGTGKTYTCKMICDLWVRLGGDVLLCALAGKAALRLSRSTGRLAKTLSRTLAELAERDDIEALLADPGTSEEEAGKAKGKLEGLSRIGDATLVVVDEASMVDLPALHALVKRLRPASRLLLVGDEAQLPPIGVGLVFHKLVEDTSIAFRLTHVHRQAAETGIPTAAAVIRAGGVPEFAPFQGPASGISFVDARHEDLAARLDDVIARLGGPTEALVVTATLAGAAGVDGVNERFHRRYLAAGHEEIRGFFGRRFSVGEPVIFGRNDYRAGLFNGLLGHVTAFDPEQHSVDVLFDGDSEPKKLADEHLVDLDLAYAVTCHKCQGSSAKRVVVPIYASRLLDRSWLYTAVTRAEQQVVLVGDRAVFKMSVAKPPSATLRKTGLRWP